MPRAAGPGQRNRACDRQKVPLASYHSQKDIGGLALMASIDIDVTVNNRRYQKLDLPEDTLLIDFLNEELGLTGTKLCCGIGVCRACTVLVHSGQNSRLLPGPGAAPVPILSCSTLVSRVNGQALITVEGLTNSSGSLTPMQQAFLDEFAFQCGYCTPGFLLAAQAMIERLRVAPIPASQVDKVIFENCGQHICRCSGYVQYHQAIRKVVLTTPGLVRASA
jgi:aerobic-type carbon monoxide dehydrogenase small subunit (CoxS/CutS family)